MSATRRARVPALAKINLDLRVLGKRPDGYHELRTIFQTISLADTIEISFTPARRTGVALDDPLAIPDNLVARAARLALDAMRVNGLVEMRLAKRIPMGGGMGGGSSDAAAVLLALPALAGRVLTVPELSAIAGELGSDVPFFLLGGTAAGIGRGTELFPLPDAPAMHGLVLAPGIHVNTAQAYRDLSPRLTTDLQRNKIYSFQSLTWDTRILAGLGNDFEPVVFEQHPALAKWKKWLMRAGATAALMSGSGSAVFGLFPDRKAARRAAEALTEIEAFSITLVSRARYRSIWRRALAGHIQPATWPPQSRYSR
ncbi:MAG: 4-(cytidine 5'-diphospho)-2-C-methyl-D-erythritol kinase [Acidobacteria bacterium]|nr:4-(cytidine 5'-diphospho)-2-C-methyl-D-erythritol kinase [Acidobacteriota bacterium]